MPFMSDRAIVGASWSRPVRPCIYDHVFSDLQHEVGGFLLGRRQEDGRLHITHAIAASEAEGRTASVTFTQDDWANVHAEVDARGGTEQIIGWYHSHPGFGIFLSEFDLFIHRNFFGDPAQVAYVIDPHAGREGLFGWRDGEVVKLVERDTSRPGERPPQLPAAVSDDSMRPDDTPARHWKPQHYAPAVLVGVIAGGALGWALLGTGGGSSPARRHPAATATRTQPLTPQTAPPATPSSRQGQPTTSTGTMTP